MKKKSADAGLAYMMELGLKPEKTAANCIKALAKASDEKTAYAVARAVQARTDSKSTENEVAFYDLKNTSLELSMTLSGAFDGDFVRQACNWLEKNRDLLQGDILDVGCDCGILTCFIARLAPQCRITAIDRSSKAIDSARLLAKRLQVNNADFVHADISEYSERCRASGITFGTIVSSRVVQENLKSAAYVDFRAKGFCEEAFEYSENLKHYIKSIEKLLETDGLLITIERASIDPHLLGLLNALHEHGLMTDSARYERLSCRELDRDCPHQAFFSGRIGDSDTRKPHVPGVAVFLSLLAETVDLGLAEYVLYEARAMEDLRRGRLIDGFTAKASGDGEIWRCAVWEHRNDPTNMLVYLDLDGHTMLSFHDISQKDEALAQLNSLRMKAIRQGMELSSMDRATSNEPSELALVSESIAESMK